jgi:hypothetical protein
MEKGLKKVYALPKPVCFLYWQKSLPFSGPIASTLSGNQALFQEQWNLVSKSQILNL